LQESRLKVTQVIHTKYHLITQPET